MAGNDRPKVNLNIPGPSRLLRTQLNRRANAQHNSKKVWAELNLPQGCGQFFSPNVFSIPNRLLRHSQKMKPDSAARARQKALAAKKKMRKSYTEVRREREEFRKRLINLIISKDEEYENDNNTFPNAAERETMRYYYYIKHGIDTVHIAPVDQKVLNRILTLIPKNLQKYQDMLNTITEEMKADYNMAVKKAVIDFVLGDALFRHVKKDDITAARLEIKEMTLKWKHRYDENRRQLNRYLFAINRCLAQILEIWHTTFKGACFVDVETLMTKGAAYDLTEFTSTVTRQIEDAKSMLNEKWYGAIQNILIKGSKRKIVPDSIKPRLLKRFHNAVGALMTRQLQDMCIRSLEVYTDYICDIGNKNQGFRLTILLENENQLTFIPNFAKFHDEILRMIDVIVRASQIFPRIEKKMFLDNPIIMDEDYLRPNIPGVIIQECKQQIHELLEEQRIGPELRMQDFDKYMTLMNGTDIEAITKFMKSKASFEDYCQLINKYKIIENEISREVFGVINMGFYDFHRDGLIDTLEGLAKLMQQELLSKMITEQQNNCLQLAQEYESIANKVLGIPKNTAELMDLKAYAAKTEDKTIPEMEERLRTVIS